MRDVRGWALRWAALVALWALCMAAYVLYSKGGTSL